MTTNSKIYKQFICYFRMVRDKLKRAGKTLGRALKYSPLLIPAAAVAQEANLNNLPIIAEQEAQSIATFAFNDGNIHSYNIYSDGSLSKAGETSERVSNLYDWDFNGDGRFGQEERTILENSYLVSKAPNFDSLAPNEDIRRLVYNMNGKSRGFNQAISSALHKSEISREEKSELEQGVEGSRVALTSGVNSRFDASRGNYFGPSLGGSFNHFYKNNAMLGLNLEGSVLFGEQGKSLDSSESEMGELTISGRTSTEQLSSQVYELALRFNAGYNGFYAGIGPSLSIANSTDRQTAELLRGENILKSDSTQSNDLTVSPGISGSLGYVFPKGFGLELNAGVDIPSGNWSVGVAGSYGQLRRTQDRGSGRK